MKTKKIESREQEVVGGLLAALWVAILLFGFLTAQGCIPLVTGIKKHTHSDGSITEFVTGFDFMFGANGTDTVENNRGINPGKYEKNKQ